jgi:hypothetical protein
MINLLDICAGISLDQAAVFDVPMFLPPRRTYFPVFSFV